MLLNWLLECAAQCDAQFVDSINKFEKSHNWMIARIAIEMIASMFYFM